MFAIPALDPRPVLAPHPPTRIAAAEPHDSGHHQHHLSLTCILPLTPPKHMSRLAQNRPRPGTLSPQGVLARKGPMTSRVGSLPCRPSVERPDVLYHRKDFLIGASVIREQPVPEDRDASSQRLLGTLAPTVSCNMQVRPRKQKCP